MPLDAKALGVPVHQSLCRQEVDFLRALDGSERASDCMHSRGCLFGELAEQMKNRWLHPYVLSIFVKWLVGHKRQNNRDQRLQHFWLWRIYPMQTQCR